MTEIEHLETLDGKDRLAVSSAEGKLLFSLVQQHQPKTILEVGTGHGYSTAWMIMALREESKLYTIDEVTRPQIAEDERIIRLRGTLNEKIGEIPTHLDFVFLDSDHQIDRIAKDIELIQSRLQPGSVVVIHDTEYCDEMGRCLKDYFAGINSDRLKTVGVEASKLRWAYDELKTQYGLGIAILGEAAND